jgi:hypothetical protein
LKGCHVSTGNKLRAQSKGEERDLYKLTDCPIGLGLLNKSKSINHRGAQALRNSPVSLSRFIGSYFSAVARLQRWLLHKDHKGLNYMVLTLCPLCLPCLPAGRLVYFVVKKDFFNTHNDRQLYYIRFNPIIPFTESTHGHCESRFAGRGNPKLPSENKLTCSGIDSLRLKADATKLAFYVANRRRIKKLF